MNRESEKEPVVDFIGVGVNRCGSTWIYKVLSAHPYIFCYPGKETHFFNRYWKRGVSWYASCFSAAQRSQIRGEFTQEYSDDKEVIRRIHDTIPNVKIIIAIRDPVDRLRSAWKYNYNKGKHNFTRFEDYLNNCEDLQWHRGLYQQKLSLLTKLFPSSHIHIVNYENLLRNPHEKKKKLYGFLGVSSSVGMPAEIIAQKINASSNRSPRFFFFFSLVHKARKMSSEYAWLRTCAKFLGLHKIGNLILKAGRPKKGASINLDENLSPAIHQKLLQYYQNELALFE